MRFSTSGNDLFFFLFTHNDLNSTLTPMITIHAGLQCNNTSLRLYYTTLLSNRTNGNKNGLFNYMYVATSMAGILKKRRRKKERRQNASTDTGFFF